MTTTGVLSNDMDVEGDRLTAKLVSNVSSGTLDWKNSGHFTFTPTTDFSGIVTFTYRASDTLAFSNLATVRIAVGDFNTPPGVQISNLNH